jgi:hypothetical protein
MQAIQVHELMTDLGLVAKAMTREGSVRMVEGGFVGDVLSHVMAGARPGYAWITVQAHENVVAVAAVTDVSCVVVCQREIPPETVRRAESEGITLLWSDRTAFEVSGRMYRLFQS